MFIFPGQMPLFDLWLLLIPVTLGLYWTKQHGLATGLVVVACVPAWLDMFFYPQGAIYQQLYQVPGMSISPKAEELKLALSTITYLSLLCFLVIIPVGLLRSRSTHMQLVWLLVPSLLTLIGIGITRGVALRHTELEYSAIEWLKNGFAVIHLWIPLVLATVLYQSNFSLLWQGTNSASNT